MFAYIVRRLLLIIPTLFAIMVINFAIIQIAPGGPVEQAIAELTGSAVGATARISGAGPGEVGTESQFDISQRADTSKYRGARGLDPELIERLEKEYGFDKPPLERFLHMMGQYVRFDFGSSFFRDDRVVDLVLDKLPVSISLGLWTTLLAYLISIPLGYRQGGARRPALRRLDQRRHHRRLRDSELHLRDPADRAVRGRQLRGLVPAAWTCLQRFWGALAARPDRGLFLAPGAADPGDGGERLRHHHDADQELLPGSDQPALRHHRARQGA